MLRLFFEDSLNLFVQWCYAVKYWDKLDGEMKVFVVSSMIVGFICSCAGPLMDCYAARRTRQSAADGALLLTVNATHEVDQSPLMDVLDVEGDSGARVEPEMRDVDSPATNQNRKARTKRRRLYPRTILDFLQGGSAWHSVAAHRLLVACSLVYWAGMACIPVLFGASITGGEGSSIPQSAVLYFVLVNMGSFMCELWIAMHTETGHFLITEFGENVHRAASGNGFKEAKAFGSLMLSIMGRYDTFSDVVFTIILCKTEKITQLHFTHSFQWLCQCEPIMTLPVPLHHVALFSVVVGVFGLQGIPGVVMLCLKKGLPAAFKLNEFNMLLAMVDYEAEVAAIG